MQLIEIFLLANASIDLLPDMVNIGVAGDG
jgi:hypothetical protein